MDAEPDAQDSQAPTEVEASSSRPPLWRRFGVWVTAGVVLYVIVGLILLAKVPDRLLATWFPTLDENARAAFLGPAANVVLFGLGGTIALVGVGLSLSRHRQELEAAERDRQRLVDDRKREQARRDEVEAQRRIDTERALRERFVTTVKLLSDPAPVNRQAALFALGALADDWDAFGKPDEVQVCIEVLTGYLRAPRTDDMLVPLTQEQLDTLPPDERRAAQRTTAQEIAVKQAGYTVIRNHLAEEATYNWHQRVLNLAGASIDFTVNLARVLILGRGVVDFTGAIVSNGANLSFGGAAIRKSGRVSFAGATISGAARVSFGAATIADLGSLSLGAATIRGEAAVLFGAAYIGAGGYVDLSRATIESRGIAHFAKLALSRDAIIEMHRLNLGSGGKVVFDGATVSGAGVVHLDGATMDEVGPVRLPNGRRLIPSRARDR